MHHLRQRGAPMQALQNRDLLSSDTNAMDQLQDFLRQRREAHEPVENLDAFAQELHRLFVTAEREALSQELSRFDLDVPVVEVDGERPPVHVDAPLGTQEPSRVEAVTLGVSLEGVLAPMKDGERHPRRAQAVAAGKTPSGPAGSQEVACATVSYYDRAGNRLLTH